MDMTAVLIVGAVIAVVLLVIGLFVSTRQDRKLVEDRVGRFLDEGGQAVVTEAKPKGQSAMSEWLGSQASRFSWGQGIARDLARADVKLKVGEYIMLHIIASGFVGGLAWWFGGRALLSGAIGAGIGFFLPGFYVRREQAGRLVRFDQQLADMLNLMVNGLRAGYSTMQALEAISRELPPPIADEFRRVVQEMQLGVPMEKALEALLRRIPSKDLDLVVTAMNVQREVGGNLSEILDTISHTIRERVKIKGDVRVLTSQVMMSGKFLASMPVLLAGALYFMNRSYMMNFFNPSTRMIGIPMLVASALFIAAGYFVMTKIADIEV